MQTDSEWESILTEPFAATHAQLSPRMIPATSNVAVTIQHQSPLFSKLPTEIRIRIYEFALGGNKLDMYETYSESEKRWSLQHKICSQHESEPLWYLDQCIQQSSNTAKLGLGLLLTCRQM